MTVPVQLYLVTASHREIDDFDAAVVYATDPDDAIAIVLAELTKESLEQAPGVWEPLTDGATLAVKPVPAARGPILGHAYPC